MTNEKLLDVLRSIHEQYRMDSDCKVDKITLLMFLGVFKKLYSYRSTRNEENYYLNN